LVFWVLGTVGALITVVALDYATGGRFPTSLAVLPLSFGWASWFAPILSPIAGAIVGDFTFYWFHRCQHWFLWRFHAVHHSIRELHAMNAWHHVSEQFFWSLFIFGAMALFGAASIKGYLVVTILIMVHRNYIHSTSRFHYGWLRAVFVDNRFHRIHHSLEPRHFNKNFGGFTTIWDRLFGTACFPKKGEWPAVGLADIDEPRTVREWLFLPWKRPQRQETLAPAE
jgi:sterol desaturase/sphingolipid hydroxylase (fatty acid hydroxylase superfamily)